MKASDDQLNTGRPVHLNAAYSQSTQTSIQYPLVLVLLSF